MHLKVTALILIAASASAAEPGTIDPGRWGGATIGLFSSAPAGTPAYVATSVGYADFD